MRSNPKYAINITFKLGIGNKIGTNSKENGKTN